MNNDRRRCLDFDRSDTDESDWKSFEKLCEDLLMRMIPGSSWKRTPDAKDGGIDVLGEDRNGGVLAAQCKCRKKPIGRSDIAVFLTDKRRVKAKDGYFISATGFTRDAIEEAGRSIKLLNFMDLCSVGAENEFELYMFYDDQSQAILTPCQKANGNSYNIIFDKQTKGALKIQYWVDDFGPYDVTDCNTCATFKGKHVVSIKLGAGRRTDMELDLDHDITFTFHSSFGMVKYEYE